MKQIIFATILILTLCFVAQAKENQCPEIKFISPNQVIQPGKSAIFEVKVGGGTEKYNLSYEWTFSKGKILKGQGTSQVEFLTTREYAGENIDVSVKVIGLPKDCSNTYSDIFPIASLPIYEPFDRFGKLKELNEYLARIDGLFISLNENLLSEGLIIISFEKKDGRSYKLSHLKKMIKFINFRKYDLTRITFAISEGDFEELTIFWIVPPGAEYPIDKDLENTIIKGEELEQKINELFPKK